MIECANRVIGMGEQRGYEYLKRYLAKRNVFESDMERDERAALLCRLVYQSIDTNTLRGPMFGTPNLPVSFGRIEVWPDMPFVFSQKIPLLMVSGYCLAGPRETGEMYLEYCHVHGVFRKYSYAVPTRQEQEQAVQQLLNSQRWKDAWSESGIYEEADARQRLQTQIE